MKRKLLLVVSVIIMSVLFAMTVNAIDGVTVDDTAFKGLHSNKSYTVAPFTINGVDTKNAITVEGVTSVNITDYRYFGSSAVGLYAIYETKVSSPEYTIAYVRGSFENRRDIGTVTNSFATHETGAQDRWKEGVYTSQGWDYNSVSAPYFTNGYYTFLYDWIDGNGQSDDLIFEYENSPEELLAAREFYRSKIQPKTLSYAYTSDEIIDVNELISYSFGVRKQASNLVLKTNATVTFYVADEKGDLSSYVWTSEEYELNYSETVITADAQSVLPESGWVVGVRIQPCAILELENMTSTGSAGAFGYFLAVPRKNSPKETYVIQKPKYDAPEGVTVNGSRIEGLDTNKIYSVASYGAGGINQSEKRVVTGVSGYTLSSDQVGLWGIAVNGDSEHADSDPILVYVRPPYKSRAELGANFIDKHGEVRPHTYAFDNSDSDSDPINYTLTWEQGMYSGYRSTYLASNVYGRSFYRDWGGRGALPSAAQLKSAIDENRVEDITSMRRKYQSFLQNEMLLRYSYAPDEIIPTDELLSMKLGSWVSYSTVKVNSLKMKLVLYVMSPDAKVSSCEWISDSYVPNGTPTEVTVDIQAIDSLPDEGWIVGFEFYPAGIVALEDITSDSDSTYSGYELGVVAGFRGSSDVGSDFYVNDSREHDWYVIKSFDNESSMQVASLSVTAPNKTVYALGERLDTEGMKVIATFTDNTIKDVTDAVSVDTDVLDTLGTVSVKVECGGKSASFDVTVKNSYTVNFYNGDGGLLETRYVLEGDDALLPDVTPTKEGDDVYSYVFLGWDSSPENIVSDLDVYPEFEKIFKLYSFTLDYGNGTTEIISMTYNQAFSDVLPTSGFFNDDDVFDGWYCDGELVDTERYCDLKPTTVCAKWLSVYKVYFFNGDGSVLSMQSVLEGDDAVEPATKPTKEMDDEYVHTFSQWDKSFKDVSADLYIHPKFLSSERIYTVTLDYSNGSIGSVEVTYTQPLSDVLPTSGFTNGDLIFGGWYYDDKLIENERYCDVKPTTLRAKWLHTYVVIFYDGEGSALSTQYVPEGKSATAPDVIPTKESTKQYDFIFDGWDGYFDEVTANLEIRPTFRKKPIYHSVTFKYDNGRSDKTMSSILCEDTVPVERNLTKNGYTFVGWRVDADRSFVTSDEFIFNYEKDVVLTAEWEPSSTSDIALAIEKGTVKPGKTVQIPISISNNSGILGIVMKLNYHSGLTLVNVEQMDDGLSSLNMTPPGNFNDNPVKIMWDGIDEDSTNGKIALLTFDVDESLPEGEYSVDISEITALDDNSDTIDISCASTTISVKNYITGDTDGNGKVELRDLIVLRRYIVGGYGIKSEPTFDINHDGKIDLEDVILLRRYIVGGHGVVLD